MLKITLEACRINAGLTQQQAADVIGVTAKSISNWETGKHKITVDKLAALAGLYKVNIDNIILPKCSQKC